MDFGYMFSGFTCCSAKLLPAKLQEGPLGRKISTCNNLAEQIIMVKSIWSKVSFGRNITCYLAGKDV